MEQAIAVFAIVNFSVIGVSHLFQHEAWREFFSLLRAQGKPGAFANGFLSLLVGSLIVSFHNVWTGVPLVLTVIGWGYVIKSVIVFVYPDWNVRSMEQAQVASALKFRIAGGVLIGISIVLGFAVGSDCYAPIR